MKKEVESPKVLKKKQESCNYSIKDGIASSINSNIESTYIPQFALALGGGSFQVGLINAFSGLLNPLSQLFGDKLMERHSRKKIIITFVAIQILLIFGIAGLAYAFYTKIFQDSTIYLLIFIYSLITIAAGIAYPSWFSIMGDITSKEERGKFFSRRNIIITLVGLLILPAGIILDKIELAGYLMLGFAALFGIAGLSRLISLYYLNKHYSPKLKLSKNYYFSLIDFVKRFDDVGKFAVYYAIFELALMIASPFFAVYMRNVLQFDYFQITVISLSSSIFYMLFAPLMGKISDKYGNIRLFYISTVLFAINPILWSVIKSFWALTLIPQLVTGLANAAMGIAVSNFIFNMTKQEHRALCISYLNILAGIGVFIGSILGGIIIKLVPETFALSPFITLFIISGIARLTIAVKLVRKLRETEDNAKPFPKLKLDFIHPLKTLTHEIALLKKIAH